MQQETKGEAMNRIVEAYCKQARLMPSLSISATTPSVNRAMVIAEVRIGEHSPNLAQAANSKPQRPKLISQACGIKLPYAWGCSKKQPHRGSKGRSGTSAHGRSSLPQSTPPVVLRCGRTSFSPRENPFSLPTILLFAPKQPPMLWENRDRYHFPNYGIAADAEPCTLVSRQATTRKPGKWYLSLFSRHGKSTPFQGYSPRVSESCHQQSVCSNRENNIRQTRH